MTTWTDDENGGTVWSEDESGGRVVSAFIETLLDDTTAAAAQTTLGISAFAQTVLDDASASDARTTLGAVGTTDLATGGGSTGAALVGFIQSDTGAVSRTVQDKLRKGIPVSLEDFGGSPSASAATNDTAWTNAKAAFTAAKGGVLQFEAADTYNFNTGFSWSDMPLTLRGRGTGVQSGTGTVLKFASGQTGITIQNGSSGYGAFSAVENLTVLGQDSGSNTKDGILIQARAAIRNVVVKSFGQHGIHVKSAASLSDNTINANGFLIENVRSASNFGSGYFAEGVDSNTGVIINLDCSLNGAWGIYDDSFLGNTYIGPHCATNTSGGYRFGADGGRCTVINGYQEAGGAAGVQIDNGNGGFNYLHFMNMADTVTDNSSSNGNEIITSAAASVLHRKLAVGTTTKTIELSALAALFDLGTTLTFKNAAQDAVWTIQALGDGTKRLYISSAQAKALLIGNPLQLNAVREQKAQGAAVASANDLTLGNDGNYFQISGTTQINRITNTDWQGGSEITLYFQGALTVKHDQAGSGATRGILLNGAVDMTTAAANTLTLVYDSTLAKWVEKARKV